MGWPKGRPRKIPRIFIPDSEIPRLVRGRGYEVIRPWVLRQAAQVHYMVVSQCRMRWDAVKRGHWVTGPQRLPEPTMREEPEHAAEESMSGL